MSSTQLTEQSLTEKLSEYIVGLRYEEIPESVLQHARLAVLDTVGAGLLGLTTAEGQSLLAAIRDIGAVGEATLWGADLRTPVPTAALVNSTLAHALELDDFSGCGHSGAVVVPAALAMAESLGSTGRELLTAVIIGYDLAVRVTDGAGGYFPHNERGWHSTGTCGTFGAAGAAARLLELNEARTTAALGIAGSYTGGIWAFIVDGAMTKRLHPGKASENGVVAAYLARRDFTGPRYVLEADWGGFFSTYMPGASNPAAVVAELGSRFGIHRSGFKPHASCRGVHGALDALLQLVDEQQLTADKIERIEVISSPYAARQLGKQIVSSVVDAQLSIPYGLAVGLLTGETGWNQYQEDRLADPQVIAWSQRVAVIGDERVRKTDSDLVRVYVKDGTTLECSVRFAKGAPENPMSADELVAKFGELASGRMPDATIKQLTELIMHVDDLPNVLDIMAILHRPQG